MRGAGRGIVGSNQRESGLDWRFSETLTPGKAENFELRGHTVTRRKDLCRLSVAGNLLRVTSGIAGQKMRG